MTARRASRARPAAETGSITTLVGVVVATGALVLLLLVDLTGYLVAAARAQTAADGAALAAVAVADPRGRTPGDPEAAALRVAAAADGRLDDCACRVGQRRVRVAVSVAVPGVVVPRLAGRRVRAVAEAVLRPP